MTRQFCDACDSEISSGMTSISIPCHLWSLSGKAGYVDGDGNTTSGRMDKIDLCRPCSNHVFSVVANEIRKIKGD